MPASNYRVGDRRPIGARHWSISRRAAHVLAQAGVSPNGISVAGMLCGVAGGASFAWTSHTLEWTRAAWLLAAIFIQFRLVANMLDGMVALESGKASPIGELFNEVPDRVSDSAILIGAGYALGGDPLLGYAAACAAMFTAYVRTTGKAAGAPHEFCGPMAKQHRMALLTALALYLAVTPRAWHFAWGDWGLVAAGLGIIVAGSLLTALRRLLRIAVHLREQRA